MTVDEPIRTLVVEDNPDDRFLLQALLESRGHEVEAFADGESAVEAYEERRYDLALLDMMLPGMSGPEVSRRIRSVAGSDSTIILFVTGTERADALEEALEAGGDDYLTKPVNSEVIRVRLAIAERRVRSAQEKERLARTSLRDPMTGLANRKLVEERLDEATRRVERESDYLFAVVALNLDRFSAVNEQYGRGVGDELLKQAARRLGECVRGTDVLARTEGDEFLILLDGLHDLSDPARVARRINEAFETPFLLDGHEIRLSCSMGMALSLSGYKGPEAILGDAGEALKKAKAQGPGSSQMFDPVMQARAQARVQMEERIRTALDQGFMELWYQPLLSLETGRILGFEALARMRDPDRGMVSPADFIPVAEESGLIAPLGWWTLEEASRRLEEWQARFPMDPPLSVAVNISGRQFADPDVYDEIQKRVKAARVPPRSLHLEITETALMTNVEKATEILNRLKDMEVRLHVDDFGTGYSSMAYLCRFPIDALKIDRSFITRMTKAPEDLEVVETIVRLADTLGIEIIAEGVEDEEQHRHVKSLGCHAVQGFLFHRPMEAEKVTELLEREAERA